jgi:sec-independent protein translocase protein TatC
MGVRGLFEGWHIVVLIVVVVLVFGWKRLPDAARSLGRSMRPPRRCSSLRPEGGAPHTETAHMALLRRRSNPEGRMSLGDHLRELRNRLIVAMIAVILGGVVGWLAYDWLLTSLSEPLLALSRQRGGGLVQLNFAGVTTAFSLKLKVALFVGVIIASPVWLYQVWAFIVPGLTRREKRTAVAFVAAAVPLFLAGCYLATWALPKAVEVLLGFTPTGAANLQNASDYLDFVTRFILAFGLAFLLPIFLVMLNVAHVLPARVMIKGWRVAVMLIFVFAAMMTPTPDAWTMLALAFPMIGLYFAAVGVAALIDRRRRRDEPDWSQLSDDEASQL